MARLLPILVPLTLAATASAAPPPPDALPLSEIIAALEAQEDVAFIDEVDWDDEGYWEIEYYRPDGRKVEVLVDPVTGRQRP